MSAGEYFWHIVDQKTNVYKNFILDASTRNIIVRDMLKLQNSCKIVL